MFSGATATAEELDAVEQAEAESLMEDIADLIAGLQEGQEAEEQEKAEELVKDVISALEYTDEQEIEEIIGLLKELEVKVATIEDMGEEIPPVIGNIIAQIAAKGWLGRKIANLIRHFLRQKAQWIINKIENLLRKASGMRGVIGRIARWILQHWSKIKEILKMMQLGPKGKCIIAPPMLWRSNTAHMLTAAKVGILPPPPPGKLQIKCPRKISFWITAPGRFASPNVPVVVYNRTGRSAYFQVYGAGNLRKVHGMGPLYMSTSYSLSISPAVPRWVPAHTFKGVTHGSSIISPGVKTLYLRAAVRATGSMKRALYMDRWAMRVSTFTRPPIPLPWKKDVSDADIIIDEPPLEISDEISQAEIDEIEFEIENIEGEDLETVGEEVIE
jgi:hypothetical protein